jgi:hypothetical protein
MFPNQLLCVIPPYRCAFLGPLQYRLVIAETPCTRDDYCIGGRVHIACTLVRSHLVMTVYEIFFVAHTVECTYLITCKHFTRRSAIFTFITIDRRNDEQKPGTRLLIWAKLGVSSYLFHHFTSRTVGRQRRALAPVNY